MSPPFDEAQLRRCIRDLVALSAIPAFWTGRSAADIAEGLADLLLSTLRLDLVYVRLYGPEDGALTEAARGAKGPPLAAAAVGHSLAPWLDRGGFDPPVTIPASEGDATLRLAVIPLGYQGKAGVVAAASRQPDFPHELDRLLLQITVNQAALREADRLKDHLLAREQAARQEAEAAREAAEAASRAKDRFLANLSHELRTPLTPVLAVISRLEGDERLPDDVRSAVAMIHRNVDLEARLIDDLLDLTRIARGKLELRREIADLRQVIEHSIQICCSEALAAGRLCLVKELGAESHRVWADASRVTQVFWNLLTNAVKFTPPGGTIHVRSWAEPLTGPAKGSRPGRRLVVEISDTGIGIETDALTRIFEGFEQERPRMARQFGGLGLGLAISKAIVEMHGGALTASSDGRNQGATFTLHLPAAEAEPAAGTAPGQEPASATAAPYPDLPLHILLVEDHLDTAAAMAELLRNLGHRVTVAGSVRTGLAALAATRDREDDRIDLVISDLGLPDGSGCDLMRALSGSPRPKGIALSGYGMEEDVRMSLEAGFERHLTKPIDLRSLQTAIRETVAAR
ncbi:MAG: response regulator [Acidobacteria bacterium]|nr:response regulator [Acidobacteriota bacterium]